MNSTFVCYISAVWCAWCIA